MPSRFNAAYVQELKRLLTESTNKWRTFKQPSAISFSGGLDSSVLAKLLIQNDSSPIPLIAAGTSYSKDVEIATNAAKSFGLQLSTAYFSLNEVEQILPKLLNIIDSIDVLQVSLAIPLLFTIIQAHNMKVSILYTGQGADELFGGYARYEKHFIRGESDKIISEMKTDLAQLLQTTRPNQQAIAQYYGIQIANPFLDHTVIDFASKLPLNYKLRMTKRGVSRKYILRSLAEMLTLPTEIINAPKRAIQYGSGSARILAQLSSNFWAKREPTLSRRKAQTKPRIHQFLLALKEKNSL